MATSAAVVSLAGVVTAVLLHRGNVGAAGVDRLWIGDVVVGGVYPLIGAYLVRRRPEHPIGWILTMTAVIGVYAAGGQWFVRSELVLQRPLPLAELGGWLNAWGWFPHLLLPSLIPLLFPHGVVPSARWRPLLWLILGGAATTAVSAMLGPVPLDAAATLTNPWSVLPATVSRVGMSAGLVACFAVGSPLAIVSVVRRARRARGTERTQLLWLLGGGLLLICSLLVQAVLPEQLEDLAWSLGLVGALAAIAVATVRSRVFDIELVLNRTLVTLVLAALVVVTYVVAMAALEGLRLDDRVRLGLVAAVSLLAVSGYEGVQRLVDRMLLGQAADPYAVLLRVGGRLDQASGPLEALQSLAEELRDVLRSSYVAIVPTVGDLPPIRSGTPGGEVAELPVTIQGDPVGTLAVGARARVRGFAPEERSLLEDVRRRAGALLQAAILVDDLQRSRERIVAAREEERRRLRHDLHDGLGPRLAGMALQLDSLAERLTGDPELHRRAERLRELMRGTVAEVRQVVDDLRPPALDELGLAGALREQLSAFAVEPGTGEDPIRVDVEAEGLGPLPAAVEVAAYRIVVEAAANAVRHGRARNVTARLTRDGGALLVEVTDDGRGIGGDAVPGVGLPSMRDRTVELGGAFTVRDAPGGGTEVIARIPLAPTSEPGPLPAGPTPRAEALGSAPLEVP